MDESIGSALSPIGRAVVSRGPILLSPGGTFPTGNTRSSNSGSSNSGSGKKGYIDTNPSVSAAANDDMDTSDVVMTTSNNNTTTDTDKGVGPNSNVTEEQYISVELFGGAISTSFPSTFEDVSVIRQVPDHQEVYVDKVTEMSCIVELLSFDESISDNNAAQHYFQDLAQCNEATQYSVDSSAVITSSSCMPCISGSYSCCALVGRQVVAKIYRRPDGPLNNVQILLFVLRLPVVGTDVLLTLNIPYAQADSDVHLPSPPMITTSSFLSPVALSSDEPDAVGIMRMMLKHFKITDWSLFA